MIFEKCSRLFGEAIVIDDIPAVTTHRDVILDGWALYDSSRRMIGDSGYFRGVPSYLAIQGSPVTRYEAKRMTDCMPNQDYFWLGAFHTHFGHFLVATLARAWALSTHTRPDTPIVYIGGAPPKDLFSIGFVRDCFTALGITEDRLLQVKAPIRFPRITVAAPAFNENHSVYTTYFQMLRSISSRLNVVATTGSERDRPVYISKEKVASGVRTIVNESELTQALQRYGVEIAYPETLTFRDQLAFWAHQRPMIGFIGSAFHMSAFFGSRRLCLISSSPSVWSNQVLLDLVSENESLHIFPPGGLNESGSTATFSASLTIRETTRMAEDIVRITEGYGRAGAIRHQHLAPEPRSLCQTVAANDPFGTNIARQGIATQSSLYTIDEGHNCTADGALSGRLTGYYQCHTDIEPQPWWQIDLKELYTLNEIRVFNRCDNAAAQSRLNKLHILLSLDGISWKLAVERDEVQAIGGLGSEPYRWLAPSRPTARFVRLQLPDTAYLHLDQVEIFGEPEDSFWASRR